MNKIALPPIDASPEEIAEAIFRVDRAQSNNPPKKKPEKDVDHQDDCLDEDRYQE